MSNREAVDSGGDIRMREIQASIAEGKMMLHVLKSLPSSENNDAFILRFEELVSRLENYRTQLNNTSVSFTGLNECMQNAVDVHSFIEIIKERQEKIAHLFAQTAKRFQQASESVPATNTESVSMCSGSPPTLSQSASSAPPTKIENSFNSTTPATSNCASADVSLPSLKKSAHFSFELDRLTAFTEDAKRFEGMTGRLVDITGRAHLTEATEFLCEIRARFIELQRSFSSLRETYEAIGSDSGVSDELHALQASSFSDFLSKLSNSLESTKECFFTIYHLVKSNIEQGLTDGSLLEIDGGEENGDISEADDQTAVAVSPASNNLSSSVQENSAANTNPPKALIRDSASSTLDAQKAYLAALQSQTKTEREKIDQLLKQRDELTERLQTLQAAAASAALSAQRCEDEIDHSHAISEHVSVTSSDRSTTSNSNTSILSTFGLSQSTVDHLEAKRRELEQLKAQLTLLKLAEEKVAVPDVSALPGGLNIGPIQSAGDAEFPLDLQLQPGYERGQPAQDEEKRAMVSSTGSSNTTRLAQPTSSQATATKLNTGDNLHSNIPVANCRSTGAPTERMNPSQFGGRKPSDECPVDFTSRASVAASQDHTTFATWGGSSAAPSSNNSVSVGTIGEEEESVDGGLPVPRHATTGALQNGLASPASVLVNRTDCGIEPLIAPPTPRSDPNALHSSSVLTGRRTSFHHEHTPISMPQVGTSPSPPVNASLESQSTDRSYHATLCEPNASQDQGNVDLLFTTQVPPHPSDERVARLENSVSQLYQICRYLVKENSQLNTTVKNLLLSLSRDVPQYSASHSSGLQVPPPVGHSSLLVQAPQRPADHSQYPVPYPLCSSAGTTVCGAVPMLQRLLSPDANATLPQMAQPQDPLLTLLSQIAQQQTQYCQLQTELQRLLLSRAQLTAGVSHYVSNQLTSPDNHLAAALLSSISYLPAEAARQRSSPSVGMMNSQPQFSLSSEPFITPTYPTPNTSIPLPLGARPLSAQSHTHSTSSTIPSAFDSHGHTVPHVIPANNPPASTQSSSIGTALPWPWVL